MKELKVSFSFLPLFIIFIVALVFVLSTLYLYWPSLVGFESDNTPASWFSSALLFSGIIIFIRLLIERILPIGIGLFLFSAFFVMSLDEQFMLHEYWKFIWSDKVFGHSNNSILKELPMISVGSVGFLATLFLFKILPKQSAFIMLVGFFIGAIALYIDLFADGPILQFEELFEIFAEVFFLSAFLGLKK
jgi:hypothetical protein